MSVPLFLHLVGFAIGLGSVLLVDTAGLLWVFGKAKASQVVWLSGIAQKLIWAAVALQVVTGSMLLEPEHVTIRTKVKLAAVLVLAVNGILLDRFRARLASYDTEDFWKLPRKLQLLSVVLIGLSQLCWWTATVIGFIASSSH